MKSSINQTFVQADYQKQKPFSSFLPGIAGKDGIPIWSFYVNRGQLISSFGKQDKNGSIMEFFPANAAYMYTKTIGFRTFIKISGQVYEFFKEENQNQSLHVDRDAVSIVERNESIGIQVTVKYFTLPNEPIGALVRKVKVESLDQTKKQIEVLDGLTQILPSGIDYGGYKAISNLLQSWMDVDFKPGYAFYKLRASTGDSAEVTEVTDGNFYLPIADQTKPFIIADTKLIFESDTSFQTPYGFIKNQAIQLKEKHQVTVNQVPCAFSLFDVTLEDAFEFSALIGYTANLDLLTNFVGRPMHYITKKEIENHQLHETLTNNIETETALPLFDAYLKQCYLDNLLRGGEPFNVKTLNQDVSYHLYSRKHGDLERDYNFFSIAPEFYSQGNGNFRDVLQNRRNDTWFHPFVKNHNLWHFASLIQADGYNPLSIEGLQFEYKGKLNRNDLKPILDNPFTPGMVYKALKEMGQGAVEAEALMQQIIGESEPIIKASFGEGYWNDHFTYLYDLIEGYLEIYPENKDDLLFNQAKYTFFDSHTYVRPRNEKYVLTKDNKVRQYGALRHYKGESSFLLKDSQKIEVTLASKLLTLILNKYGILDPEGIGLSYEANKPGWNDAMNGLPGLFGSGVSEMFELKKLNQFLLTSLRSSEVDSISVLSPLSDLIQSYLKLEGAGFDRWHFRQQALENYRLALLGSFELTSIDKNTIVSVLEMIQQELNAASDKALALDDVLPTYLTFEATKYEPILKDGKPVIGDYGLPLVNVLGFKMTPIKPFLEAPARFLKQTDDKAGARNLYHSIKRSDLYDKKMKFYQTSVSLDEYSNEIGRIRAFTKGWLERESNFLHMTYKYLLGLLKAGLYDEFYEEIDTNLVCFMNPSIYGRSPLENSSFLATSTNPDPSKHGQGFVSRLSGSTAEMLSMYKEMFIGKKPFEMTKDGLTLTFRPKLHKRFFKDGKASFKFYNQIVTYINKEDLNTYDDEAVITDIEIVTKNGSTWVKGSSITNWASDVREGNVRLINVFINREEAK